MWPNVKTSKRDGAVVINDGGVYEYAPGAYFVKC